MLDVYDVHLYLGNMNPEQLLQQHRIWFDTTYEFALSNGVRFAEGNWQEHQKKQYFFERINRWLNQYFGPNHGIGLGVSESAIMTDNPETNLSTVWYASMLGTFADHGVELFTPWTWDVGQYEVMHLFSKKGHNTRVLSRSSLDTLVSAYSSISKNNDSLTVILVNRDLSNVQNIDLTLKGFEPNNSITQWQLSDLGTQETFVSETQNALEKTTLTWTGSSLPLTLPAKSITALQLSAQTEWPSSSSSNPPSLYTPAFTPTHNPPFEVRSTAEGLFIEGTNGSEKIQIFDIQGHALGVINGKKNATLVNIRSHGVYFIRIQKNSQIHLRLVQHL